VDEKLPCAKANAQYDGYYALYQKLYRQLEGSFEDVAGLIG
jgi:hypothetical protein